MMMKQWTEREEGEKGTNDRAAAAQVYKEIKQGRNMRHTTQQRDLA